MTLARTPATASPGLAINGKFLSTRRTAVHLVAHELIQALLNLNAGADIRVLVPAAEVSQWPVDDWPLQVAGRLKGIAWEQLSLPYATRGRLLVNLCNMTPLTVRRSLTMVHDAQVFTTPQSYGLLRSGWARLHTMVAGRLQPGLLTVSEFAKSELVALGIAPAARIHVIPNGVDHVLRIIPEDGVIDRLGLAPRGYALALANTQPHKNIGLLLRAFARPGLAQMTLVLAGRASAADFVGAGFPVSSNVVFAGYVSDGEMRSLQTHALAVCTPSLTEGFGLPPVEGMLLGTPAVIAPCGALPEVCGPGTLTADPQDPAAWEAALLRLRDEPGLWHRQSQIGQAFAARFTWEAAARKLVAVISGIMARERSS